MNAPATAAGYPTGAHRPPSAPPSPPGLFPTAMRALAATYDMAAAQALTARATPWQTTMSSAHVPDGDLRNDYTAAAVLTARRYPGFYPLIRLLFPSAWQPYFYAVSAFGIHADCLVDVPVWLSDPVRFHTWAEQVRRGLRTGWAEQPFLRAFLHTVAVRGITHSDVEEYLAGQAERLWLTGYATEQDRADAVDHIDMPAARMQCAVWLPLGERENEHILRLVMDAGQRVDDLADLAADLGHGMLTIPQTDLLRFGVPRSDLESGRDTWAVRALLAHQCAKARTALAAARAALEGANPGTRFVYGLPLAAYDQVMSGVERQGAALTRHGVIWHIRPSPLDLLHDTGRLLLQRLRLGW